ncbi:VSPR family DNA mismatch endonuclease [Ramlibacter solisilvae]|uniref:very short patch repair endonuclease n=1 Tax=Ramlibacter tataouinensis TaxID=94132 RepID=UPI0009EDADFB|nr:very short patch repair endonuclease [Ramlibacter tataouinensis]
MPDVHNTEVRSRNMRAIRSKDTAPERAVRKALHAAGFRYRLQSKRLPGRPDLTLTRYRAVVFVHGCFWHQHDCPTFKMPRERRDFWRAKLEANVARDAKTLESLQKLGWRVAVVWECALRGRDRLPMEDVTSTLANWLRGHELTLTLRGRP